MEMITAENKANETKEKRMLSESEKKILSGNMHGIWTVI